MKIKLHIKQILAISVCLIGLLVISCKESNENNFSYEQFKDALYYNSSTGEFSDLGNLEMCINRWGTPEYVKSMGSINLNNGNSRLNSIVFKWSNIEVDEKNVEIVFEGSAPRATGGRASTARSTRRTSWP